MAQYITLLCNYGLTPDAWKREYKQLYFSRVKYVYEIKGANTIFNVYIVIIKCINLYVNGQSINFTVLAEIVYFYL